MLTVDDLRVDIPLPAGTLHAVRGVSFRVERGETLCIVGESGCGKSLTALAIMGLLPRRAPRTAARLELRRPATSCGVGERAMSDMRGNRMAMIFQEPMTSLNPAYTIGDQLAEALSPPQARVAPRRRATAPSSCWNRSASRPRRAGSGNTRTSSRAACASAS